MPDPTLSAEEVERLRAIHGPSTCTLTYNRCCQTCNSNLTSQTHIEWPCPVLRALDALDAATREREELKADFDNRVGRLVTEYTQIATECHAEVTDLRTQLARVEQERDELRAHRHSQNCASRVRPEGTSPV